jgi:hypothetical protein
LALADAIISVLRAVTMGRAHQVIHETATLTVYLYLVKFLNFHASIIVLKFSGFQAAAKNLGGPYNGRVSI